MQIELAKTEIIHFVGIGGIGMSGLSLIMKGKGFKVQGSDINYNKNIDRLKSNKIKVFIGHKKQNISKATILVVSSAIKKTNPELIEAKKKKLPIYKRGEMLANIVSLTKNIVVVWGMRRTEGGGAAQAPRREGTALLHGHAHVPAGAGEGCAGGAVRPRLVCSLVA